MLKMGVRRRLQLSNLLQILSLLFFVWMLINLKLEVGSEMEHIKELNKFGVLSSSLVHELQIERALTARMLSLQAEKFKVKITAQRTQTDIHKQALEEDVNFLLRTESGPLLKKLKFLQTVLTKLAPLRHKIDQKKKTEKQMTHAYSEIIQELLKEISVISKLTDDGTLTNELNAFASFLQAKEAAGIERAVLAHVFHENYFNHDALQQWFGLLAAEKNYLGLFQQMATDKQLAAFKKISNSPAFHQVKKMQTIALKRAQVGGFKVNAEEWFKVATKRIDLLRQAELELEHILEARVEELRSDAVRELIIYGVTALVLILMITFVTLRTSRNILRPLGGEPAAMEAMAKKISLGDLEIDTQGEAEASGLFASMLEMTDVLKERARLIQKAANGDFRFEVHLASSKDTLGKALTQMAATLSERAHVAGAVAQGDFSVPVVLASDQDQLGQAFSDMTHGLSEVMRGVETQAVQLNQSANSLSTLSVQMSGNMSEVGDQVQTIAGATTEVSHNIESVAAAAKEMSANINTIAAASTQMSSNMDQAGENLGSLSESIVQVASQSAEALQVSVEATTASDEAKAAMDNLNQTMEQITQITSSIKHIADQTNMLALNATIESASAGAAGKGFSVVAHEVKELAGQSSQAAENIFNMLQEIQSQTARTSRSIKHIGGVISKIHTSSSTISDLAQSQSELSKFMKSSFSETGEAVTEVARMVSEMTQAASEVASSSEELALGTKEISRSVSQVANSTKETLQNSTTVQQEAAGLTEMSNQLTEVISRFKLC